jgi:two-component system, cell cycle sensor histidine kinase and response regulator CckA
MSRSRLIWVAGLFLLVHALTLIIIGTRVPGPLMSNLLELSLGVLALSAAHLAGRRSGPYGHSMWLFVAISVAIWDVAQAIIVYYEDILHASLLTAWPSDPLIFFWVVPLFMALFLVPPPGRKRLDPVQMFDFGQVMILAMAAYLAYLFVPSQWQAAGQWMAKLGWDATNVRDALLAGGLLGSAVLRRGKLVQSLFRRLAAFFLLYLFADLIFHYVEEVWNVTTGSPWDLLWSLPFVALIAGASTWNRPDEAELADIAVSPHYVRSLLFLASAFLPLPVLLVAVKVQKETPVLGATLVAASLLCSGARLIMTQRRRDQSELRFRGLVENSPLPMLVTTSPPQEKILLMNRRFTEVFGYTMNDVFDVESWWPRAYPESSERDRAKQRWEQRITSARALSQNSIEPLEAEIACLDGSRRYVEIHFTMYADGALVIFNDLTDRRKAEATLRESEERFRQMAENSPDMFWLYDVRAERLLYVSPAYEKIWGRKVEDLYTNPRGWRDTLHPEDQEPITTDFDEHSRTEGTEKEYRIIWPDGSVRWLHGRTFPIRDAAGEVRRLAGIVHDVTERKHAEEAVRESEDRFRRLAEASFEGVAFSSSGRVIDANSRLAEMLGCNMGELLGTSVSDWIARESLEQVLEHIRTSSEEPYEHSLRRKDGTTFPVESRARYLPWKGKTVRVTAIRDITDRKRAEEALRHREMELKEAQRLAQVGSWEWEVSTDTISWSDELYRIARRDPQLPPPSFKEFPRIYTPDSWKRLEPLVQNALRTGAPYELEMGRIHPDGTKKWFVARGEAVRDASGQVARIRGTVQDITERKQYEEALQAERAFTEALIDSLPGVVYILDQQGEVVRWNRNAETILGYAREELSNLATLDVVAEEDRALIASKLQEAFTRGSAKEEARVLTKDGRKIPFLLSAMRAVIGNKTYVVGTGIDITERKRAEEALRESEELFRQMAANTPYAFILWDVRSKRHIYINPSYETIWGQTPESLYADVDGWKKAVYPDDQERMYRRVLGDFQSNPRREGIEDEFRIVRPDGSVRWVHMNRFPVRDEAGNVYRIGLVCQDVTQRKQAESTLVKLKKAVDSSGEVVFMTDLEGVITSVNPEFTRLYGYTEQEVVGKATPRILKSGNTNREEHEDLWAAILDKRQFQGEMINRTKDGRLVNIETSVSAILGDRGEILGFLAIQRDIAERKRAEEALQAEKAFSEAVIDSLPGIFYVVDTEGNLVRWNKRAPAGLGYSNEELAGMSPFGYAAAEDRSIAMAKRLETLEKGSTVAEVRLQAKDGRKIPFLFTGVRAAIGNKVYVVGTGIDISDRKQAEEALKESEARSRALVEDSLALICTHALDGTLLSVNPAAASAWGGTPKEIIGKRLQDWLTPSTRHLFGEYIERIRTNKSDKGVMQVVTKNGEERFWLYRNVLRQEAGKEPFVLGYAQDITDRKRVEEELQISEARYRTLIESAPEAIVVADFESGKFVDINENARLLFGLSKEELLKIGPVEASPPVQPGGRPSPDAARDYLQKAAAGETPVFEWVHRNAAGKDIPCEVRLVLLPSAERMLIRGSITDITERKRAEEALMQSKASLAEAQRVALMGSWEWDILTGEERWSDEMFRLVGLEPGSARPTLEFFLNSVHPDDREAVIHAGEKAQKDQPSYQYEYRAIRADGAVRIFQSRAEIVRDAAGKAVRMVGATQDVTERKRAEEALRASQQMFYRAFHSSPEPICIITISEGKFLDVNDAFCEQIGYTREEVIGRTANELGLEPLSGLTPEQFQLLDQGGLHGLELDIRTKTGEVRNALVSFEIVEIAGQPCLLAQGRDVTEQRRAVNALRASDQRYRDFISHSNEGVWRMELEQPIPVDLPAEEQLERIFENGYLAECNDAMARIMGVADPKVLIGKCLKNVIPTTDQGRIETFRSAAIGRWQNRTIQFQAPDLAGRFKHMLRTEIPIIEDGMLKRVWGMTRDVSDLHQAEEALRASEERYRLLFERSLAGVIRTAVDGRVLECNEAFAQIQGYASRQEVISANVRDFYFEKSDGTALIELLKQYPMVIGEEFHARRKDGSAAWMLVSASLIEDEKDEPTILATAFDITHWKELGEQLRQSQKMEAVGRLAGGVAHDFNNMLQIINGYSELVIDQLPPHDPLQAHVQEIKSIVERAAGLTRQLLAFSRQQVLAPQVLDLKMAITNLSKMLRRLIGEDIDLVMIEGHRLSRVKADPGQVDQVIMNLAVNARDAMPRGGKLTIETANVKIDESYALGHFPMTPGRYVMIAVSDTGHGMNAETQARIFEPFFTTKEKGKGTGLGLATVYGIVKQSGGFIWVQSEMGKGTTFKIFLPPVEEAPVAQKVKAVPVKMQGTETVLLVEDEEYVRSLVRRSLQSKGYLVLEARSGQDALHVAQEHQGPIHLLITDVVMPGMSGRELAERLTPLRREMKTLYMSGYADDSILHHGVLDAGGALLQKPFTAAALASKVRQVLERD